MSGCESATGNPFARALFFYWLYLRSKLTAPDLEKIAKKYAKKREKLMPDLQQKYPFSIPQEIARIEIQRICEAFPVPQSYRHELGELGPLVYSARLDVYSADFDASFSLREDTALTIAQRIKAPVLDNLSKCLHLLPGSNAVPLAGPKPPADPIGAAAVSAPEAPKVKHIFETIAEMALLPSDHKGDKQEDEEVNMSSPMALLYRFMKDRVRVRIIIRRNKCLRGSMDAYVKAFDKHFNMLLSDVDEQYIVNQHKKKGMVRGSFRNPNSVLRRHLPQLLLRGDTVVSVFPKPNS